VNQSKPWRVRDALLKRAWMIDKASDITLSTASTLAPALNMDGIQLRDEAVRDRIRACEEFLDPSM